MRITGGVLKGRTIRVPKGPLRPTSDRVREALFSSIGDEVRGATVLDLFAGTGALGLEAMSRGASTVWWVERSPRIFRALRETVHRLEGETGADTKIIAADATRFLSASSKTPLDFDLVFADPPYEAGWLGKTLRLLAERLIVTRGGLVILEQGAREPLPETDAWFLVRDKVYGDTRLLFYRHCSDDGTEEST